MLTGIVLECYIFELQLNYNLNFFIYIIKYTTITLSGHIIVKLYIFENYRTKPLSLCIDTSIFYSFIAFECKVIELTSLWISTYVNHSIFFCILIYKLYINYIVITPLFQIQWRPNLSLISIKWTIFNSKILTCTRTICPNSL